MASAVVAVGAGLASGGAAYLQIEETLHGYETDISNINAQIADTQGEAARRVAATTTEGARMLQQTKVEGVANLQELGKENAYDAGITNIGAQMTVSSGLAKLGVSGARATASPLLAQQQAAGLAQGAAAEKTRAGNAGIAFGGLKLGGSLADISAKTTMSINDINAQASLTTAEYERQRKAAEEKRKQLARDENALVALAGAGGTLAAWPQPK
jgi:hypothetical protein